MNLILKLKSSSLKESEATLSFIYSECYFVCEQMILKNNGSADDAKDVFQDAMVVFYNKVKGDDFILTSKISTYLYAVSRNLWLKKLRTAQMYTKVADDYMESIEGGIEIVDESTASDNSKVLADLMEKSGEKCLNLLKMFYFEKLKMQEISENFGFASQQVAKNQKVRCLKKLRTILSQYPHYKDLLSR